MSNSSSQIKVQLALPDEKIGLHDKLKSYWQLIRADKPIGILFLLWPALWALWIAGKGNPDWYVTLVFILSAVLLRSAGSAINDYADRHIDGKVLRTRQRPIASGIIKPREAIAIFAGLGLVAFLLVLTLNLATILMFLGALALAAIYPFSKRFTYFPQAFLGIASGWGVVMAFAAIQNTVLPVTWVLYAATIVWVMIYDTEYAMVDREDDVKIGVKSTAVLFGKWDVYIIGLLQLTMLGLLFWVGALADRSWFYFVAVAFTSLFFVRQQQLMKRDIKAGAFAAFLNNNCFGMTLFIILLFDYIISG